MLCFLVSELCRLVLQCFYVSLFVVNHGPIYSVWVSVHQKVEYPISGKLSHAQSMFLIVGKNTIKDKYSKEC